MAVTTPPALVVPLYLQLGDGNREHLGDVTVALNARGTTVDDGHLAVQLGVVDPNLVTDQVANLLDNAAHDLRKGVVHDATP